MDLLSVADPEAVVDRVRALRADASTGSEAAGTSQTALAHSNFESTQDALQAIDSMEAQLNELYREKLAVDALDAERPPDSYDTFEQLQSHVAQDEKLRRKLGVSSADDVIEMVEALVDQLDVLYAGRERLADLNVSDPDGAIEMIESMKHQLDALYAQQEQLATCGAEDAEQALLMIENMDDQLTELYGDRARQSLASSSGPGPLLPPDTLSRLGTMNDEALDALPVGLFCLDAQDRIRRANATALDWPRVRLDTPQDLHGTSFFAEVAPGLEGLFERWNGEGDRNGLSPCIPYTYDSDDAPPVQLVVQCYQPPDDAPQWILFRFL